MENLSGQGQHDSSVGGEIKTDDRNRDIVERIPQTNAIATAFHPNKAHLPSPEYKGFLRTRQAILDIIRNDSEEKTRLVTDIVDALLERDPNIPTDISSAVASMFKIGKKVKIVRDRRRIYNTVIVALLEQLFDPQLEFKMSKKDILDSLHAAGADRDSVTNSQIEYIYVRIIQSISAGELRDLSYDENITRYVSIKLEEIKLSRQDWELNGR